MEKSAVERDLARLAQYEGPTLVTKASTANVKRRALKVQRWVMKPRHNKLPVWVKEESNGIEQDDIKLVPSLKEKFNFRLDEHLWVQLPQRQDWNMKREDCAKLLDIALLESLKWPIIADRFWEYLQGGFYKVKNESVKLDDTRMSGDGPVSYDIEAVPAGALEAPCPDLLDIQNIFYDAMKAIHQTIQPSNEAQGILQQFNFSWKAEQARRQDLESRYMVGSTATKIEDIRALLGQIQNYLGDETEPVRPGPNVFGDDRAVQDQLRKLEKDLIPLQTALNPLSGGKGAALASTLARQDIHSQMIKKGSSVSSRQGDKNESIALRSDAISNFLNSCAREWTGVSCIGSRGQSIDPSSYLAKHNSLLPTVNTRRTLEAYNAIKVEASVLFMLTKQRDTVQAQVDRWGNKLMEMRKSLRNTRRNLPAAR